MNENYVLDTDVKLVVSQDGQGDYTSINEALAAANDGDKIYVNSGVYNEELIIKKNVSLIGNRINQPILSIPMGNICEIDVKSSIRNFIFENTDEVEEDEDGYYDVESFSMVEVLADCDFDNCIFRKSGFRNVYVGGKESEVTFFRCSFINAHSYGVGVVETANVLFSECKILQNEYGIYGYEGATLAIDGCEISNSKSGIDFSLDSKGAISNCIINNIKEDGIASNGNAKVSISNCVLSQIGEESIVDNSKFTIAIYNNQIK